MSTNNYLVDTMTTQNKRTRRDYSRELKTQILRECEMPGASVAQVAMAHGINANLVHGWRKHDRECREAAATAVQAQLARTITPAALENNTPAAFVPVTVMPSSDAKIDIEVRKGTVMMKATWPLSAASQCAAWVREVLE